MTGLTYQKDGKDKLDIHRHEARLAAETGAKVVINAVQLTQHVAMSAGENSEDDEAEDVDERFDASNN